MNQVTVNVERLVRLQRRVKSLADIYSPADSEFWMRMKLAEIEEEIDSLILEGQGLEKPKTDLERPETGEGRY